MMTLLPAAEDFSSRTLASIPGSLHRLIYLAGLRGEAGTYSHWGMEHIYGETTTSDAIAACHLRVLRDVLRMPLGELLAELRENPGTVEAADGILSDMRRNLTRLVPAAAPKLVHSHLSSVLVSLRALIHASPQDSNPQAA